MRHCILFLLLTAVLSAQTEVEITAEPHHHLIFENSSVRVFYVDIPPHTDSLMHWHRHDYAYVMLGPAEVVNATNGQDPFALKLTEGETALVPNAPFAHIARNIGDQPFRNLTIEILNDANLRHSTAKYDEDRGLSILNAGTAEILFVKEGIRATEFELQPGGMVPGRQQHSGSELLIAVSSLDLRDGVAVEGSQPMHLASGEVRWLPAGHQPTLTNIAKNPAKFVTLEFPKAE